MGGAMMRSWLYADLFNHIDVIDPMPLPDEFSGDARVRHFTSPSDQKITSDILVLAVKPQVLREASRGIASALTPDTVLLSIAAGQSLAALERVFGSHMPVIRAMPNTPAAIGKGASVCVANAHVTDVQKDIAQGLLEASGTTLWVEDEGLMDAVTALSGSGPAYVFYFIEALARAGQQAGLSAEMSMALARQTVIGSAALAEHDGDVDACVLRKNVTSPGGTTQAALETLMDGRFQDILSEALQAAKLRARALDEGSQD